MFTLRFLDDDMNEVVVDVIRIEKADVRPLYDTHIRSVEVSDGWWELWNIDGCVCGYFEEDEDY